MECKEEIEMQRRRLQKQNFLNIDKREKNVERLPVTLMNFLYLILFVGGGAAVVMIVVAFVAHFLSIHSAAVCCQ